MHVIQSVGSLAPETGGPARSVGFLSQALAEAGIKVTLLTLDFNKTLSPPMIPDHELITPISVPIRLHFGMQAYWIPNLKTTLERIAARHERLIIHDHGIWLPQNHIVTNFAFRKGIPLVISPRGMLEPEALKFSKIKKIIAWHLFQKRNLLKADVIHATSQMEKMSVSAQNLDLPVCIIPNATVIPPLQERRSRSQEDPIKLLFISRIHPKKGLLTLVDSLALLNDSKWELTLAGYDEGGHLQKVLSYARQRGVVDRIHVHGPVGDNQKWDLYHRHDVFVLPSKTENFGIVVAEALAAGLPVITTTGTPWEELLADNCGWWVEHSVDAIAGALTEALGSDRSLLVEMGKKGRKLVERKYSWPAVAREMKSCYEDLLSIQR